MSTTLDLLTDACVGLPHTARKMFGGHGFFAPNGGMFAGILSETEVMLKFVEGPARTELISIGGHPWVYEGQSKPMTMKEWIVVPESFFDDPERFASWAKRAHTQVPPKKVAAKKKDDVKKVAKKPASAPAKKPVAKKKRK
ncbi:MAG: TfoX/Sxy family protein [Archangiaceae bacterium]|nr:TfoX/Sxy family protein [Archangiaceae bacterium]